MRAFRLVWSLVFLGCSLLLVPGCGSDPEEGGVGGSCTDYNGITECLEYSGTGWTASAAEIHCQGMMGTHATGVCEQQGALGRCTITPGDANQYWHVYYDRLADAEAACALNNGVWELL